MTDATPLASATRPVDAASNLRAARTRALLEAPTGPTLAKLAAPNVLAMFVQAAQSIAEAYFASLLGVTALAGLPPLGIAGLPLGLILAHGVGALVAVGYIPGALSWRAPGSAGS